jgi:hypothetical protein
LGAEYGLEIDQSADNCRVRSLIPEPEESVVVPLPKPVFRAVLARLAALCNERNPGSASPYGGEAEIPVDLVTRVLCRVAFTNTPSTQRMRLTRTRLADQPEGPQQAVQEQISPLGAQAVP